MPTYEAPIFLKVRQRQTNDGPVSIDTTGATTVSQETTITFPQAGEITIARLPAGSAIQNIRIFSSSTVTPGGGGINISLTPVGGTLTTIGTITYATPTANTTTLYQLGSNIAPVFAQTATWQNIGTSDAVLSVNTGLPVGVIWYVTVTYTYRNMNGSLTAQGAGYSN